MSDARPHQCLGFTLLELLAVLVVVSSAMALSVGALGRTSSVHAEGAALRTVHQAWQRTSLLARRVNGAVLRVDENSLAGKARQTQEGTLELPFQSALPPGWFVTDTQMLEFDSSGRAPDARFTLFTPERNRRVDFTILGVTGQLVVHDRETERW